MTAAAETRAASWQRRSGFLWGTKALESSRSYRTGRSMPSEQLHAHAAPFSAHAANFWWRFVSKMSAAAARSESGAVLADGV